MKISKIKNPKYTWYKPWTWKKVMEVRFDNDFLISEEIYIEMESVVLNNSSLNIPKTLIQRKEILRDVKKYLLL